MAWPQINAPKLQFTYKANVSEVETAEADKTPTSDTDALDHQKRKLASRVYVWRAVLVSVVSLGGFSPLFYLLAVDGVWYHNAMFKERYVGPELFSLLSSHAWLGLVWTLLSIFQAVTGATQGENRRKVHRLLGRYVGPVSIVSMVVLACATDLKAMVLDPSKFSPRRMVATFGLSLYTVVAFFIAYYAALRKDYATHKDMIVLAITLSSLPGIQRILWYIMQAFLKCEVTESVAARMQVRFVLLLVMITAFWRLKRFTRLNVAFLVAFIASALVEIPTMVEYGLHPCEARRENAA